MQVRKGLFTLLMIALVALGLADKTHAQSDKISVRAVMILASNEEAPKDQRLANIENKLRSVLGFQYYKHYGEGSASITMPGSATVNLGKGYSLNVKASAAEKGKVRIQVAWREGSKPLLSTSTVVQRNGAPAVLGGASHGKGKLIVTLSVR